MPLRETTLYVTEKNDPLRTLWFLSKNPDRSWSPYDLTGAVVEFYQKTSSDDVDPVAPQYSSTGGSPAITILAAPPLDIDGSPIIGATTRNAITVQMAATNLGTKGIQFFRVDVIRAGKRETIMKGPIVIENA